MQIKKKAKSKQRVKVNHHQTYRLSNSYNNAECGFSISLDVEDNPTAIQKGLDRAEKIVTRRSLDRLTKQAKFLAEIVKS